MSASPSSIERAPAPTEVPLETLLRFRTELPYYSAACLKIRKKDGQVVYLEFNFPQSVVHEKLAEQKRRTGRIRAVILKARQEGISTYVGSRNTRGTTLWSNVHGLVIAHELEPAGEIFGIYERFSAHLPQEVEPRRVVGQRGRKLAWHNGSQLRVNTANDAHAGRGTTLQLLHASEVAFWEHAEDTMLSLLQAVAPEGSEVIVESTANGVGNYFHRLWERATSGASGWVAIFLPWWIHEEYTLPLDDDAREHVLATLSDWERAALEEGIEWEGESHRLSPEQLAWRRRTIEENHEGDERSFRQEYPATAREAFLVAGNAFFDEEKLLAYEQRAVSPEFRGNLVRIDGGIVPRKAERGWLECWERPVEGGHYVIGADTAEGRLVAARDTSFSDPEAERGGRDFCSADVLRIGWRDTDGVWHPPKQVAQLHGRMAPEVFAEQLWMLGHYYSCAPRSDSRGERRPSLMAIERNHSSGQTVLKQLREVLSYPYLYWRRRLNIRTQKVTPTLGWVTDGETRPVMLDELAAQVRSESVEIPSPQTVKEMFTFVRGEDGRPEAQEGCHDDRCVSLAIALQMAKEHTDDPAGVLPEPEVAETPTGY